MARTRMVKRWRRNMDVLDDTEYVDMLTTLSEGSVRRNFNPYTDIDWDSPEFAVIDNDQRWILPATDPLGRHPWYQAQPLERQIEIGMWRQANVAKVGLHFESDPDPRADELRVLGAQRLPGIPVLPARVGRRVQPHHDVSGDGEPHRRRRAGHAAAAALAVAVHSAGRRPAAHPVLLRRARRRGTHRPHAEERAARGQVAAPDHGAGDGHSRGRGGPPHLVRARVPAQAGAAPDAAASASGCRCTSRSSCGCCARPSWCRRAASGRNSTSRGRCARSCSSVRRSPGSCCATCSPTSGCSATTPV